MWWLDNCRYRAGQASYPTHSYFWLKRLPACVNDQNGGEATGRTLSSLPEIMLWYIILHKSKSLYLLVEPSIAFNYFGSMYLGYHMCSLLLPLLILFTHFQCSHMIVLKNVKNWFLLVAALHWKKDLRRFTISFTYEISKHCKIYYSFCSYFTWEYWNNNASTFM